MIGHLLGRRRAGYEPRGCRGVTIVELITIGAVLAILAAFAIPGFSPVLLRYRVRGAAWQVAGDLRLARQRAVTMKKPFRFCVTGCIISVPPGGYSLERDDGPPGGPQAWVNENGVATRLPPDVAIAANANPTFTVIGTVLPSESGTVTLSNLLGTYNVVVAQSGRVRVCEGACP